MRTCPSTYAQANYASVCPSKRNGASEEILPGYYVQYQCDVLGPYSGTSVAASSPKDCARLCQSSATPCEGSTWFKDKCVLNTGSGSERPYFGAVYMKKVDGDEDDEDPFLDDLTCEEKEEECNQKLDKCEKDLANLQVSADDPAVCNAKDGREAVVGGKTYKVWCNANNGGKDTGSVSNVVDLNTCAALCSSHGGCTRALWRPTKLCLLFSDSQNPNTKPTGSTVWHSAIRV